MVALLTFFACTVHVHVYSGYVISFQSTLYVHSTYIVRFVMLLLAMMSLHMLTFRLMVTMVAEFCSLVILIHNTLLGEITISST